MNEQIRETQGERDTGREIEREREREPMDWGQQQQVRSDARRSGMSFQGQRSMAKHDVAYRICNRRSLIIHRRSQCTYVFAVVPVGLQAPAETMMYLHMFDNNLDQGSGRAQGCDLVAPSSALACSMLCRCRRLPAGKSAGVKNVCKSSTLAAKLHSAHGVFRCLLCCRI